MIKRAVSPLWAVLLAVVWMASVGNVALWQRLSDIGLFKTSQGWGFAAALALMIASLLAVILSLLNWRHTLKPAITLLLIATAMGSHFMLTYHVIIDPGMMTNVVQTDLHEARDLVDVQMLVSLLLLGVLPAWLLWRQPLNFGPVGRQVARNALLLVVPFIVIGASLFASFQTFASVMRSHTDVRYLINPLNSAYAVGRVAAAPFKAAAKPLVVVGADARVRSPRELVAGRPPLLVVVLGETGRSGNFSLNGYARPTNPELTREGVASFTEVWSCGTSTAASVPCMFSPLGREEFIKSDGRSEGLLDVLQRAGMAVLWIDNQGGCKGTCERVPTVSTSDQSESLDEVMLEGLDDRLKALDPKRRAVGTVVVLHQIGSHGPAYHLRSPASLKPFMPECTGALQDCSRDEIVNAYDNSIAYTDHFLARTIAWLKTHDGDARTAMMYVADHGESLGENNVYLHGLPYGLAPDLQKRVPWISWLSPQWQTATGVSTKCLDHGRTTRLSHDNFYHSVLGLMDVETETYRRKLDAYASCRPPTEVQGEGVAVTAFPRMP